jgi:hypothetical protein
VQVEDELKNMCIGEPDEDEADADIVDIVPPTGDLKDGQQRPQSAFRRGLSGLGTFAKRVVGGGRKESAEDAARFQQLQLLLSQCRHTLAHPKGGLINDDHAGITKSRGVLAEVVKQIGKKILRGQNVMGVSFPVRCCQPRTILECAAYQFVFCPHYLQLAAKAADPVERLKNVTAAFIACIHTTSQFVKPFNPVLGETLQADVLKSKDSDLVFVCVCVYIYVYIYRCMYVCMYVCMYILHMIYRMYIYTLQPRPRERRCVSSEFQIFSTKKK